MILAVVLLNALIGTFQEGRAEHSMRALRRLERLQARIVRSGLEQGIEARAMVPGDILLLAAGDAVPADARLLYTSALEVAEAALTGESVPIAKNPSPLPPDIPLADRRNMVYAGTHVTAGRGRAVIVATGPSAEIGRLSALAEAAVEPKTPLERRIQQFGHYILATAAGLFVLVNIIGFLYGHRFMEILMIAISQVVSMIPEGLPVAMTITLSVGVQRMARRGAIVRRLPAVETLGSTTVICTDKTGTLTRNEMTVTTVHLPGAREIEVTGAGYAPEGQFFEGKQPIDPEEDEALLELLRAGVLCNDANLIPPELPEAPWRVMGDPTEAALLALAAKGNVAPSSLRESHPRRAELSFDPTFQMMATQHDLPGDRRVFVKGAPEAVLGLCTSVRRDGQSEPFGEAVREEAREAAERMASRALRVLAFAVIDGMAIGGRAGFLTFQGKATFLGLVGQLDPPRPEVGTAIRQSQEAGIRVVMVTGDHKETGLAIARELGIAREGDLGIDGRELERMSERELAQRIGGISVFARVHPAQKLRIVDAYQREGEVVAMTGDGVNDAPALAQADVGVAMGISGTEVAKEAAKIIVTDDNFATIVAAVEEGRLVYRNIKKVILYLFATSLAAVVVLLAALLLDYPPPLAAVQILWINIITEGVVTVNLILEPPEGNDMALPPIPRGEPLLHRALLSRVAFMTPAIVASTFGWFAIRSSLGIPFPNVRAETFTVLAACCWFNVLNCRSETRSSLNLSLLTNRWLLGGLATGVLLQAAVVYLPAFNRVFHTAPFSLLEVVGIVVTASLVLWVEEIRKYVARGHARRTQSRARHPRPRLAPIG